MAEDAPDAAQHAAFHALQQQAAVVTAATTSTNAATNATAPGAGAPRGPYRGKCLYKTGKCTNERALKTSGAAHNLCDEHRRRQNEHQRKLDSKNRYTRKDKRASLVGSERADAGVEGSTPSSPSSGGKATTGGSNSARYAPYEKSGSGKTSSRTPHETSAEPATTPSIKTYAPDAVAPQIAPVMMQAAGSMQALPVAQGPPVPTAAAVTHAAVAQPPPVQVVQAPAPPQVEATPKVYMSPAPQPPQMAYQYMMQDFDGVVVPLPSYLEGHERIDFRARIYQKVLDFISEECIRRFGGKMAGEGFSQNQQQQQQQQRMYGNGAPVAAPMTMGYYPPPPSQQQQQQYIQPVATHHYQSEAAPQQQQHQQQQQQHVIESTHTPSKSVNAPTPDKEKRSSRAKQQVEAEEGGESTDEEVEEQQPPAKKKARRQSTKGSRSDV